MQSLLPQQFIKELYRILLAVEPIFLTAHDLDFSFLHGAVPTTPLNLQKAYKEEFTQWAQKTRPVQPHILLLHDTDSGPQATIELCTIEHALNMVSTVSTYARWAWSPRGVCEYDIDFVELLQFQQKGFAVTYHCNAASQVYHCQHGDVFSNYDADIDFLRTKGFRINFYAAHGESRLPKEWQNVSYFYPAHVKNPLISTHSGYGFRAHAFYDDGGLCSVWQGMHGDVRNFLCTNANLFQSNARIHMLLHPQSYYAHDDNFASNYYTTHPWVKEYWELYNKNQTHLYWSNTVRSLVRGKP